jgi:hypothetical protein
MTKAGTVEARREEEAAERARGSREEAEAVEFYRALAAVRIKNEAEVLRTHKAALTAHEDEAEELAAANMRAHGMVEACHRLTPTALERQRAAQQIARRRSA